MYLMSKWYAQINKWFYLYLGQAGTRENCLKDHSITSNYEANIYYAISKYPQLCPIHTFHNCDANELQNSPTGSSNESRKGFFLWGMMHFSEISLASLQVLLWSITVGHLLSIFWYRPVKAHTKNQLGRLKATCAAHPLRGVFRVWFPPSV